MRLTLPLRSVILFSLATLWDHAFMGETVEPRLEFPAKPRPLKSAPGRGIDGYGNPITEQLRIVGQRRREAEEKLDRHLKDARTRH